MKFSGLLYYLRSIPPLLFGVKNWGEVFKLALSKRGSAPHLIRLRDGSLYKVNTLMDVWVLKETCLDQQYERFGTPVENDWTVIDIGGGWGDFSIDVARKHPGCRVIAFEPFGPSVELFKVNLALNAVGNVELIPAAVGRKTGKLRLSTAHTEAVQLSTAQTATQSWQEVDSYSLKDVLRNFLVERCDLLKMDCEGGEYEILFFAEPESLKKIQRIVMETHDGITSYMHTDLIRFLQESGYRVKFTENPVHPDLGMLFAERLQEV